MTNEEIESLADELVGFVDEECQTHADIDTLLDLVICKIAIMTSPTPEEAVKRRDIFIDGLIDCRLGFEKFAKAWMVPGNEYGGGVG